MEDATHDDGGVVEGGVVERSVVERSVVEGSRGRGFKEMESKMVGSGPNHDHEEEDSLVGSIQTFIWKQNRSVSVFTILFPFPFHFLSLSFAISFPLFAFPCT